MAPTQPGAAGAPARTWRSRRRTMSGRGRPGGRSAGRSALLVGHERAPHQDHGGRRHPDEPARPRPQPADGERPDPTRDRGAHAQARAPWFCRNASTNSATETTAATVHAAASRNRGNGVGGVLPAKLDRQRDDRAGDQDDHPQQVGQEERQRPPRLVVGAQRCTERVDAHRQMADRIEPCRRRPQQRDEQDRARRPSTRTRPGWRRRQQTRRRRRARARRSSARPGS